MRANENRQRKVKKRTKDDENVYFDYKVLAKLICMLSVCRLYYINVYKDARSTICYSRHKALKNICSCFQEVLPSA